MSLGNIRLDTKKLDQIAADLDRTSDETLQSIAFQVEAESKNFAPIKTGALKGSIITSRKKKGLYWVQDGVDYGIFQELGTYKMAAHPFMVPAVERVGRFIYTQWARLFR